MAPDEVTLRSPIPFVQQNTTLSPMDFAFTKARQKKSSRTCFASAHSRVNKKSAV